MPNNVIVDICDDLVTYFGTLTLSQTFTARRVFLPVFDRENLSSFEVTVYPAAVSQSQATRASSEFTFSINVVVRKNINPASDPDISASLYFTQELADKITRYNSSVASWTETENDPIFDLTTLVEKHEFLTVITASYKTIRS